VGVLAVVLRSVVSPTRITATAHEARVTHQWHEKRVAQGSSARGCDRNPVDNYAAAGILLAVCLSVVVWTVVAFLL